MRADIGILICAWSLSALLVFPAVGAVPDGASAGIEAHRYVERVGDVVGSIHWCAFKKPVNRLIFRSPREVHVTETDETLATIRWRLEAADSGTKVSAFREGDAILISGTFGDRPIEKRLPIDEAPWFQSSSLSLRPFVLSAQTRIEYWTVRQDTMTIYKLVARKEAVEQIDAGGGRYLAQLIEVRVSGPLSVFWSSRYWFRLEDGVFLQFEGPSGPPGEPDRIISYEGPAESCDPANEG